MNQRTLIRKWIALNTSKEPLKEIPKGKASGIFFEGPVLYSYGHHWPLGVITENSKVYLNTSRCTQSTNRQTQKIFEEVFSHINVVFSVSKERIDAIIDSLTDTLEIF